MKRRRIPYCYICCWKMHIICVVQREIPWVRDFSRQKLNSFNELSNLEKWLALDGCLKNADSSYICAEIGVQEMSGNRPDNMWSLIVTSMKSWNFPSFPTAEFAVILTTKLYAYIINERCSRVSLRDSPLRKKL